MRNLYLLLFSALLNITVVHAQSLNYNFSTREGVMLENMTNAALIFGEGKDGATSAVMPLHFPFNFSGVQYNDYSISTDGFITLGIVQGKTVGFNAPLDGSAYEEQGNPIYPMIAPWTDQFTTGTGGWIKARTVGNPGARKLVVEWNVLKFDRQFEGVYDQFQLWLFEGSNKIQFVYGNGLTTSPLENASVGFATSTEFISVNTTNHTAQTNVYKHNDVWPGRTVSYIFSVPGTEIESEPIVVNAASNNVSCNGLSNGSVTLSATGGDGTYVYTLGNASNNTGMFSNLAVGTYTYTVTDNSNTLAVSGTIAIAEPAALTAVATLTNAKCGVNNGAAFITANGGTGTYTYTLSGTTNATGIFSNLAPGNYTATITDNNHCTANVSFSISQGAGIAATIKVYPEYTVENQSKYTIYKGYGNETVILHVETSGGLLNGNTYTWSPAIPNIYASLPSAIVSPNVTTTYTVTVKDDNGCSVTKSVTINVVQVSCGYNKVLVCKAGKQECISESKVHFYLERGYKLGPCINNTPTANANTMVETLSSPIDLTAAAKGFSVYPVPGNGMFSVRLKQDITSKTTVTIIGINGTVISSKTIDAHQKSQPVNFDLTSQPAGMYTIRVATDNKVETAKVLIAY